MLTFVKKIIKSIKNYFSNEEKKERLSERIVYSSAYTFSAYLDANLFIGLAVDAYFKYFLGIFGVVWTTLKTTILKKYLHTKQEALSRNEKPKGTKFLLIAYLLFASVSYFATQGFIQFNVLSQISSNTQTTDITKSSSDKVTRLNNEITSLTIQVNSKLADKKSAQDAFQKILKPKSWEISENQVLITRFDKTITDLNSQIKIDGDEIDKAQKVHDDTNNQKKVVASSVYDVLADSIPWNRGDGDRLGKGKYFTGQNVQFLLGSIIGIAVEVALWITIRIGGKKTGFRYKENKNNLYLYINSLFAVKGTRLTPDAIISDRTGLSLLDCRRYRNLLAELKHDERPLINLNRGGSTANFSKEDTLKILETEVVME